MFYVIYKGEGDVRLLEFISRSLIMGKGDYIVNDVLGGNSDLLINASIVDGEIIVNDVTEEYDDYSHTLIAKENDLYIAVNVYGGVTVMTNKKVLEWVKEKRLINCLDGEIHYYKEYKTDREYEKYAKESYKKHIDKCKLLGIEGDFEYKVIDNKVVLLRVKGLHSKVIIPSFIDVIYSNAYNYRLIDDVRLPEGLKIIGNYAFYNNNINKVDIPETVEFIGYQAFCNNKGLKEIKSKDGIITEFKRAYII